MAHSVSSRKRVRQNVKRNARNRERKRRVKLAVRTFDEAIASSDQDAAREALRQATKAIDQVAAKGTIPKNAAARRKSGLAKQLNALSADAG